MSQAQTRPTHPHVLNQLEAGTEESGSPEDHVRACCPREKGGREQKYRRDRARRDQERVWRRAGFNDQVSTEQGGRKTGSGAVCRKMVLVGIANCIV